MPKLMCDVKTCLYHQSEHCVKDRIKVCNCFENDTHETMCNSYKPKKTQSADNTKTEFGEIRPANEYLSVNCDVCECVHNQNEICKATNIRIDGTRAHNKNETLCMSFSKKIK